VLNIHVGCMPKWLQSRRHKMYRNSGKHNHFNRPNCGPMYWVQHCGYLPGQFL
jgi:hypothetical protein